MTIESDTEDSVPSTSKNEPVDDSKLDPDFVFDLAGDPYSEIINKPLKIEDIVKTGSKPVRSYFCRLANYNNNKFQRTQYL